MEAGLVHVEQRRCQRHAAADQLDTDVTTAVAEATETLEREAGARSWPRSDVELTINDPVAKTEEGKPVRIIRNAETNLGDLCADAYRYVVRRGRGLRQRRRHPRQHSRRAISPWTIS